MEIKWNISQEDIQKLTEFYKSRASSDFVMDRKRRNIDKPRIRPTRNEFWNCLTHSLLTTQQRSGPNSRVYQFIRETPYSFELETCTGKRDNLYNYAQQTLSQYGIRWSNKIAVSMVTCLTHLNNSNWGIIDEIAKLLLNNDEPANERKAAELLSGNRSIKGIGNKQSRNLLQTMGLTKYEIPLDSRVIKWMNNHFNFPLKLSTAGLQDKAYYNLISDGIQMLCEKSKVYPCLLDAAIFSSFDLK